jgi:DnaJ-class molecular chaperone
MNKKGSLSARAFARSTLIAGDPVNCRHEHPHKPGRVCLLAKTHGGLGAATPHRSVEGDEWFDAVCHECRGTGSVDVAECAQCAAVGWALVGQAAGAA